MRQRLEYAGVRVVATAVRFMPCVLVRACGRILGFAFYVFDGPHRRLAYENLRAAFPLRSRREQRAVARAVFAHFGRVLMELLKFSSLPPRRMLQMIEIEGEERVRSAHANGRGVLFFTGHFGFWEIHAIAHALLFSPTAVVGRALDNPQLNALLERVRSCTGNHVIYRRGAIRRILRALGSNDGVALLIDQHIQSGDAVYIDFFSRPAATTSALAALALRTGAPVIPVFALPLPGGRYKIIYEHTVEPPRKDAPDAIREFTQRCTDVLEMYVRRYPELWLWMHRRWRDIPAAEAAPLGMFPAAGHEPAELRGDE
ncbi:MAG: lysophospholipid acyltransferase family protein [Acidobacteria bacterium]|nr:lysophospholipid acyltransferase family protein [Acidobacteriota bacterium]